jgi:hypothetical protein
MIAKAFEVRDKMTMIPVLAVKFTPATADERWLFGKCGFGQSLQEQSSYVWVSKIASGEFNGTYDCWAWPGSSRTMQVAHEYIAREFHNLKTGDVVDVEFILGETTEPKESEQWTVPF